MGDYAVARLDEIDEMTDGRCPFRPVRHHFGITSFGVNAWTAREAGDRIINEHDEDGRRERGALPRPCRGAPCSSSTASASTRRPARFVFARPGVKRTAFAEEPGTTVDRARRDARQGVRAERLGALGAGAPALRGRRLRGGRRRGCAGWSRLSVRNVFYNLACCESLTGRTEDAIEHLRRAIELAERFRTYARDDSDFDAIRDDARFQAARRAVGGSPVHDDGYFDERVAARYDESAARHVRPRPGRARGRLPRRARGPRTSARARDRNGPDRAAARSAGSARARDRAVARRWPPGCGRSRAATRSGSRSATSRRPASTGTFALAYLVFNTIENLTTQEAQVACFRNVAAHLEPGGCFVVEVEVPELQRLPPGETMCVFDAGETHWGIDEVDVATAGARLAPLRARSTGRFEQLSMPFRYVWPAELDLMAQLAG